MWYKDDDGIALWALKTRMDSPLCWYNENLLDPFFFKLNYLDDRDHEGIMFRAQSILSTGIYILNKFFFSLIDFLSI